ncbi:hypothetical protein [Neobacillus sp. NPDC093127]|uniref:hypothetical protein n=1 Tax=Neobacillus sp. NPDC093127 TaxID=3364296 RepID=UPI0037F76917
MSLSIPLLLAFLAFNFLHFSNTIPRSHPEIKAIINLDDSVAKSQSDDEKKQLIDLQILFGLTLVLLTTVIPLINLSSKFDRKHIFLIPIFHQSNYVILPLEYLEN